MEIGLLLGAWIRCRGGVAALLVAALASSMVSVMAQAQFTGRRAVGHWSDWAWPQLIGFFASARKLSSRAFGFPLAYAAMRCELIRILIEASDEHEKENVMVRVMLNNQMVWMSLEVAKQSPWDSVATAGSTVRARAFGAAP